MEVEDHSSAQLYVQLIKFHTLENNWPTLFNKNKLKKFYGENAIHAFFWAGFLINTCSSHSALYIISLF